MAVWRCLRPGIGHFASHAASCEGHTNEGRLGFLPTRGTGLVRTYSPGANVHWVSAAPIPPSWNYEMTLGYLLETGGDGRTAIYSCRSGSSDQFLSTDPGCEGREPLGREGWVYATPPAAEETNPLYRCLRPGIGHFASHDPACEGQKTEALLGYLRRRQSALHQYVSRASGTNWVTTGAPGAGFRYQRTLGFLVESGGSNLHPIYGCRSNSVDHYLSLAADCEGFISEGREGFAFDQPPGAEETVALYRCIDPGRTHFASLDPNCEGQVTRGAARLRAHGRAGPAAAAGVRDVGRRRRDVAARQAPARRALRPRRDDDRPRAARRRRARRRRRRADPRAHRVAGRDRQDDRRAGRELQLRDPAGREPLAARRLPLRSRRPGARLQRGRPASRCARRRG